MRVNEVDIKGALGLQWQAVFWLYHLCSMAVVNVKFCEHPGCFVFNDLYLLIFDIVVVSYL